MLQLERQKLILEYLKQNRKATTNELIVGASGIEVGENCAEHFGRDLSAALTERRRGSLNARIVQNLS